MLTFGLARKDTVDMNLPGKKPKTEFSIYEVSNHFLGPYVELPYFFCKQ